MAAVVPDDGVKADLTALLGAGGVNVTVRLYRNDYTPDGSSVHASFLEADYDGYAPYAGGGWTAPAILTGGIAYVVSPALNFTATGSVTPNVVYGWWSEVTISGTPRVVAAERFGLPRTMDHAGALCPLQVTYTTQRAA